MACDCDRPDCYRCKLQSLQISPSATPSRRNNVAPRGSHNNSWEKGIHRHDDGTPVRGDDGKVIGLAQKSSAAVDQMLRDRSNRARST